MKNFCEGFNHAAGTLVGFLAALMVLGWAVEAGERKAAEKSKAKTEE